MWAGTPSNGREIFFLKFRDCIKMEFLAHQLSLLGVGYVTWHNTNPFLPAFSLFHSSQGRGGGGEARVWFPPPSVGRFSKYSCKKTAYSCTLNAIIRGYIS